MDTGWWVRPWWALLLLVACQGRVADGALSSPSASPAGVETPPPDRAALVPPSGIRRLTAAEYDQAIRDLLLDDASEGGLVLPEDNRTPFDNDAQTQTVSEALIGGAELLAADAVARLVADADRFDAVVGCSPTAPDDEACLRSFISRWGRLALRRTLAEEEVDLFTSGASSGEGPLDLAREANDFRVAVGFVVQAILQDPEFLYRIEVGAPVASSPGLYRLSDLEVAVRLSFLLWGSVPDDALLSQAEAGELATPEAIATTAQRMLDDPRASGRLARFHSMWLGYERRLPEGNTIADAMRAESSALIDRVLLTEALPWQDVFRFGETFVTDELAQHYGLSSPAASPDWVPYDNADRRGLLSHGSFLSIGFKFGDTSPVQRGLAIRERVFCQTIPPPPATVDVDEPPPGLCKEDRYAAHASGGCAGCHALLDPVGFGLENYDSTGRYRAFEPDNPDTAEDETVCEIRGQGQIEGVGSFRGPAQLADLAIEGDLLSPCLVEQFYRFSSGRGALGRADAEVVDEVATALGREFGLQELLLAVVTHESFRFRREEEAP